MLYILCVSKTGVYDTPKIRFEIRFEIMIIKTIDKLNVIAYKDYSNILTVWEQNLLNRRLVEEIISGNIQNVMSLVGDGANINAVDEAGVTPLMVAEKYASFAMWQLILTYNNKGEK